MKLTKVVKSIFIINIITFLLMNLVGMNESIMSCGLFSISSPYFQIHQLISHMFLHGSALHIIFNMIMFITFGPVCERRLGGTKFLVFYLIAGLVASFLFMITDWYFEGPMIGASGAVSGVFFLFCLMDPDCELNLFLIPINIKAKYIASGILAWDLIAGVLSHMGVSNDHTAHFAHVGGALMGLLVGLGIRKRIIK